MLKRALVYVNGKSSPSIQPDGKEIDVIDNSSIEDLPNSVYDEIELLDVLEYDESMETASDKLLNGRYKMCSVHALREKLESQAFEIGLVAIAGFRYILEAKRP